MATWSEHFKERGSAVPPFNAERAAVLGVTEDEPALWPDGNWSPAEAPESHPPVHAAAKAEWVDYAISRGLERADAEAMTKDSLIEQFGD